MPSRETVITTITTDAKTGEDIVFVETIKGSTSATTRTRTDIDPTTTEPVSVAPVTVLEDEDVEDTAKPKPSSTLRHHSSSSSSSLTSSSRRPSTPPPSIKSSSITPESNKKHKSSRTNNTKSSIHSITPLSSQSSSQQSDADVDIDDDIDATIMAQKSASKSNKSKYTKTPSKKAKGSKGGKTKTQKENDGDDNEEVVKKPAAVKGPKQMTLGSFFSKGGVTSAKKKTKTASAKSSITTKATGKAAGTKRKADGGDEGADDKTSTTSASVSSSSTTTTTPKKAKSTPAKPKAKSTTTKRRPRKKAKKSPPPILKPNLPTEEIKSIVLGAHINSDISTCDGNSSSSNNSKSSSDSGTCSDNASLPYPLIEPPKERNANSPPSTIRGIAVKVMLPQMVLTDKFDDDDDDIIGRVVKKKKSKQSTSPKKTNKKSEIGSEASSSAAKSSVGEKKENDVTTPTPTTTTATAAMPPPSSSPSPSLTKTSVLEKLPSPDDSAETKRNGDEYRNEDENGNGNASTSSLNAEEKVSKLSIVAITQDDRLMNDDNERDNESHNDNNDDGVTQDHQPKQEVGENENVSSESETVADTREVFTIQEHSNTGENTNTAEGESIVIVTEAAQDVNDDEQEEEEVKRSSDANANNAKATTVSENTNTEGLVVVGVESPSPEQEGVQLGKIVIDDDDDDDDDDDTVDMEVSELEGPTSVEVEDIIVIDDDVNMQAPEQDTEAPKTVDTEVETSTPKINVMHPRKKQKKRANLNLVTMTEDEKKTDSDGDELAVSSSQLCHTQDEIVIVGGDGDDKDASSELSSQMTKAPLTPTTNVNELQPKKKRKKRASLTTLVKENQMKLDHFKQDKSSNDNGDGTKATSTATPASQTKEKKSKSQSSSSSTAKVSPKKSKSPVNHPTKGVNATSITELSEEDAATVAKFDVMKEKYLARAKELVDRGLGNTLLEEDFQKEAHEGKLVIPEVIAMKDGQEDATFSDEWVGKLAELVQGSPLPIDNLARVAQTRIVGELTDANLHVSVETVASKIKLIATRSQNLTLIPSESGKSDTPKVDIFADESRELMWRWDLSSLEILPSNLRLTVKKARAIRRKLKMHQKAVTRLIQAINDATVSIKASSPDTKKQRMIAKVSTEEEKVLKYERDEEKARLLNDAKKQKELEKQRVAEEKRKAKELLEETKKAEKVKKEEAKKVEKAQKQEEKERKKKEEDCKKKQKAQKQRNFMRSFFEPATKAKSSINEKPNACGFKSSPTSDSNTHDSSEFWSLLGTSSYVDSKPFTRVSNHATNSKKRRVRNIKVSVFAPSVSNNPFDQQVYYEERVISIRNKYKYLSFREDERPPYHGTWSKPKSSTVTGRNPFGKDTAYLDYDVDSEAEWEEGDDEMGEDCSESGDDDENMEDEEGDITKYNYQDGWLAKDEDLEMEDDDEETKDLRRRKVQDCDINGAESRTNRTSKLSAACVIAPLKGGLPESTTSKFPSLASDCIEGIDKVSARELFDLHCSEILIPGPICMDLFPPSSKKPPKKSEAGNSKSSSQEMSREDLITFAKFVHNSTIKSKDMVVEELRNTHKDITSSRAQAMRKLDSIAKKRRIKNGGGVIWEVKNEILEALHLHALVKHVQPVEDNALPKKSVKVSDNVPAKKSSSKKNIKVNDNTVAKKSSSKKNIKTTTTASRTKPLEEEENKGQCKGSKDTKCTINASKEISDDPPSFLGPKTTHKEIENESPSKKRKTPASLSLLSFYAKKKKNAG